MIIVSAVNPSTYPACTYENLLPSHQLHHSMSLTLWPPASFLVTAPGFSRRVVQTSVQSLEGCNPCGLWTRSAAHSAMPVSPPRKIGYVGARVPSKAEAARRWHRTSQPTPDSRLREEPKAQCCWQPAAQTHRWKGGSAEIHSQSRYSCRKLRR